MAKLRPLACSQERTKIETELKRKESKQSRAHSKSPGLTVSRASVLQELVS